MTSDFQTLTEFMDEYLDAHPEQIDLYLAVAFEESQADGDWGAFLDAVKRVVDRKCGVSELAEQLGCSRPSLYKTLSAEGNPRLDTIDRILRALGYRFTIQPIEKEETEVPTDSVCSSPAEEA